MDLEQQLRRAYDERLGCLDVSGSDLAAVRRTGARLRRRRVTATGAVVAVLAVIVVGVVSVRPHGSPEPSSPVGHWREIPAAPLSPRAFALGVWTGHEVLFIGGETRPCPPTESCDAAMTENQAAQEYGYVRDGAAYDPSTNRWRSISPAPWYQVNGADAAFAAGASS